MWNILHNNKSNWSLFDQIWKWIMLKYSNLMFNSKLKFNIQL